MATIWLHSDYISVTFWLHFGYIPATFWLHSDFILSTFWLHSGCILATFWLHYTTFWLPSDYILTTFRLYSIYEYSIYEYRINLMSYVSPHTWVFICLPLSFLQHSSSYRISVASEVNDTLPLSISTISTSSPQRGSLSSQYPQQWTEQDLLQ